MKKGILIIPDVHGRDFWKEAVDNNKYDKIIFLGDYADQYDFEGITDEVTVENLKSIIAYKQQNPNKVILLLGNHDLHYFSEYYYELAGGNRYSPHAAISLQRLFQDNHHLFQLAWETELCDRHILFSHAGITQTWLRENLNQIGKPDAWHLNRLIQTNEGLEALGQVGRLRGGFYESGSMVWADVVELAVSDPLPNCYQVVGHTMQLDGPIITDKFACLDSRMAFSLNDKGCIQSIDSGG
jgi:predicted phosphodiesterase